ncbi:MAG: hypothetical protein Q7T80_07890 [Methanoregula sp.]|nr:hypothetical protein [Methanoregula sp.]
MKHMVAMGRTNRDSNDTGEKKAEYQLVVYMLITLTALVLIVLIIPIQLSSNPDTNSLTQILKYRQDILTVIITAFSAWIGAGAAYFFGRENLREATQGMLQMRELPPREMLRQISLKDLPPRPITWKVKTSTPIKKIYDKLIEDVNWWFIVVTKEDDSLSTVIEEEAVWRYINEMRKGGLKTDEELETKTVESLLEFIRKDLILAKKVDGIYVKVSNNYTLGVVNDLMLDQGIFLAIITDDANKPVSYVSSDDIRKAFLKMT